MASGSGQEKTSTGTKTLMVLRHAKSSWSDASITDHDRPLNKRGIHACAILAKHLIHRQTTPDLIYVSSAKRTRETLERIQKTTGWNAPIDVRSDLYGASCGTLMRLIQEAPNHLDHLLIVGHNPGLQDLLTLLVQRGRTRDLDQIAAKYPTGAFCLVSTPVRSWAEIAPGVGRIEKLLLPRQLDQREKARRWG